MKKKTTKKEVKPEVAQTTVFKDNKQALLAIAAVVVLTLVALNFTKITGNAITDPSSLTVFQDGERLTIQVNYPSGKYGLSNNVVYMQSKVGSKREDQSTKCDTDYGYVARGNSKCVREIAVFNLAGDKWQAGDSIVVSIKGTNVKTSYIIR